MDEFCYLYIKNCSYFVKAFNSEKKQASNFG